MIRSLRRRHLAVWIALALLLPLLLFAALRARHPAARAPIPEPLAPYAVPADDAAAAPR